MLECGGERRVGEYFDSVCAGGYLDAVGNREVLGRSDGILQVYPYRRPHAYVTVVADERYCLIRPIDGALHVVGEMSAISLQNRNGFLQAVKDRTFQDGYVLPGLRRGFIHVLVVGDILHECRESRVHVFGTGRAVDRDRVVAGPFSDSRGESAFHGRSSVRAKTVDEVDEGLHLRRSNAIHAYGELRVGFHI